MSAWTRLLLSCCVAAPALGQPRLPPNPIKPAAAAPAEQSLLSRFRAMTKAAANPALPPGHIALPSRQKLSTFDQLSTPDVLLALGEIPWTKSRRIDDNSMSPICPYDHLAIDTLIERAQKSPKDKETILAELKKLQPARTVSSILPGIGPLGRSAPGIDKSFNAAVTLARLGEVSALPLIDQKLHDTSAPLPDRIAAGFTLADFADRLNSRALLLLFDRLAGIDVGKPEESTSPINLEPDSADLLASVLWMAKRAAASPNELDKRAQWASRTTSELLRRVAASSMVPVSQQRLRQEFEKLLKDESPRVRSSALAALCQADAPKARPWVQSFLRDADLSVRCSAIEQLRSFPDTTTRNELREKIGSDSPKERLATVLSADALGFTELVYQSVDDKSEIVRVEAARLLAPKREPAALRALVDLTKDRSSRVQESAIESLARRPADESVPALLDSLELISLRARSVAWESLKRAWPAADGFVASRPPLERKAVVDKLREQWSRSNMVATTRINPSARGAEVDSNLAIIIDQWFRLKGDLRREKTRELTDLGPSIVPAIERFLLERDSYPSRELIHEVLAPIDPIYAMIDHLFSGEDEDGKATWINLARGWTRLSPTRAQAIALTEYLPLEREGTAWLRLLPILDREFPDLTLALAKTGLQHGNSMVRSLTCDLLSHRASHRLGPELAKLLIDTNRSVRISACRAAAKDKLAAPIKELKSLAINGDWEEQLESAACLAELGDQEGWKQVTQLLAHENSDVRRRAVIMLRSLGTRRRRETIGLLVNSLGDRTLAVRESAIQALESLTGVSFAHSNTGQRNSIEEQINLWRSSLDEELSPNKSQPDPSVLLPKFLSN